MKQKPREFKRFVIADLGPVPRPSKHILVILLLLLIIIIIIITSTTTTINVPKTGDRVGLKEMTKLGRVVNIFGQGAYQC